jgi:hypothetical protein
MTLFVPHFYFKVRNLEILKAHEIISETQKRPKNGENSHSLDLLFYDQLKKMIRV